MVEALGGSRVALTINYEYTHTPYFFQEKVQPQNKQAAGIDVNFTSNFSHKIDMMLSSKSMMYWGESGNSKNRYFEENTILALRADIMPKVRFTSSVDYSYKHSYDFKNPEPAYIFWEASLSRKVGNKGEISLNGYNLLNVKNRNNMYLNPEYFSYRSHYSPGRYFLITYALKVK